MVLLFTYFLIAIIAILAAYYLRRILRAEEEKLVPLLVVIPGAIGNVEKAHTKSDQELSEELYKRLHEQKIPFSLEVVVESVGEEISFYVFVQRKNEQTAKQIIKSLWPESYVDEADYADFWSANEDSDPTDHTNILTISLAKPYAIPLASRTDAFAPILHYLGKLKTIGEAVSIQWVLRPANPHLMRDIGQLINELEQGNYQHPAHIHEHFLLTKENLPILREKVRAPLFAANCRVVIHGPRKTEVARLTADIEQQISSMSHGQNYNQLIATPAKKQSEALTDFLEHYFQETQELVISARELATLFHLPGPERAHPKIRRKAA